MSYEQDPNDSTKQIPSSPDFDAQFNKVTLPVNEVIQERPNSVIINKTGIYAFLYTTTGSLGGTTISETYISGSEVVNAGPIELTIQPVAWRKTDGAAGSDAVGQVTFLYTGVK